MHRQEPRPPAPPPRGPNRRLWAGLHTARPHSQSSPRLMATSGRSLEERRAGPSPRQGPLHGGQSPPCSLSTPKAEGVSRGAGSQSQVSCPAWSPEPEPSTHVAHGCQLLTQGPPFQSGGRCLLGVDSVVINGELGAHEVGPAGHTRAAWRQLPLPRAATSWPSVLRGTCNAFWAEPGAAWGQVLTESPPERGRARTGSEWPQRAPWLRKGNSGSKSGFQRASQRNRSEQTERPLVRRQRGLGTPCGLGKLICPVQPVRLVQPPPSFGSSL